MVLDDRIVELVHEVVDHAQEAERCCVPRVELEYAFVRDLRFGVTSEARAMSECSGMSMGNLLELSEACSEVDVRHCPGRLGRLRYLGKLDRLSE